MGLDMYLSARKHINKINWDLIDKNYDSEQRYEIATTKEYKDVIEAAEMQNISKHNEIYGVDVSVNVAYWRKDNQIHNWFVDNVQNGEDNCSEYYVSHDKLQELLATCRSAYSAKDPSELMPVEGFFFGGTDIDDYYWQGVKNTIDKLDEIVNLPEFDKLSFYYQSSW